MKTIRTDYRVGNPVLVDGKISFVMKVLKGIGGYQYQIYGYDGKLGKPDPVSFDGDVVKTYEYLYAEYNHADPDCKGKIDFSKGDQLLVVDMESWTYSYNGETFELRYLHDLFNIVEEICGYRLPHYYPMGDMMPVSDKPVKQTFPVAPIN